MKFSVRFLLVCALSTLSALAADLTISFKTGKAGAGKAVHYYTGQFHRQNDESTRTDSMVDYGKGTIYMIDHKARKVQKVTFDEMARMVEQMNAQMGGMMGAMMGGMFGNADDAKVEDLGAEVVAGRTCAKYRITVGKIVQEVSADPSLKMPADPAAVAKAMKLQGLMKAFGPAAKVMTRLGDELAKIKGVHLKTKVSGLMGQEVVNEATEVKQGPIPASVFVLPADYKVESLAEKMKKDMGGQ